MTHRKTRIDKQTDTQRHRQTQAKTTHIHEFSLNHLQEVMGMKHEMRRLARKLSELEVNQSRQSVNGSLNGSESSVASSSRSQAAIDKKMMLYDQWLKDLDLRLQISDTATYDGILIWKINEYARRWVHL